MEGTELRIGNWVRDVDGIIRLKDGDDIDFAYEYEPLLLTEKWLKWFGFKKWGKNTFYLGAIKIHHRKRGFVIAKRYQDIIYVHTLQNIVHSLTGKELRRINKKN